MQQNNKSDIMNFIDNRCGLIKKRLHGYSYNRNHFQEKNVGGMRENEYLCTHESEKEGSISTDT